MRVIVLSFHYPPDLMAASFRSSAFVRALSEKLPSGSEIHVVTGDKIRRKADNWSSDREGVESNGRCLVKVHRAKFSRWNSLTNSSLLCLLRYAWRVFRVSREYNPNLVIASSSMLGSQILGAIISTRYSSRLHLDTRDLFTDNLRHLIPGWRGRFLRGLLLPFKRWAIRKASSFTATNEMQGRYLQRFFGVDRCAVISNGLESSFYKRMLEFEMSVHRSAADFPAEMAKKKVRVLYAGNIGRAQALHEVLPGLVMKLGDDVEWRVVGNGPCEVDLRRSAADIPHSRLKIISPVCRDELIKHYHWADILFLNLKSAKSNRRAVPSKIFEYAATGKPIFAGVEGVSRRIINRIDGAWCFSPGDLSSAIRQFSRIKLLKYDRSSFCAEYDRERLALAFTELVLGDNPS